MPFHFIRSTYFLVLCNALVFTACQSKSKVGLSNPSTSDEKGLLFQSELALSSIDSFVRSQQNIHEIPAVSLALIKDGTIVYFKNYGVINSDTKVAVSEESVFEAASITKPVFAYTVCKLAQKKLIDLDKPMHERFPFPEDDIQKYPCYKNMTPRHVLTHTSGLNNWGVELNHCPGEKFGYSGQGFEFLTKALAQSFTEEMDRKIMKYLKEEVLIPFDMNSTFFIESDTLKARCVTGHLEGTPQAQIFPESPEMAYGMHSNAEDIAKFAIGLLNRDGLSDAMSTDFFQFHTLLETDQKEYKSDYDQAYGLGIYLRDSPYGMVFGHSGSNYDFKCLFEVYDQLKMGYVIMTNSDTGDLLNNQIAKFLIEGIREH